MIRIWYDPKKPGDLYLALLQHTLGVLMTFLSIAAVVNYYYSLEKLYEEGEVKEYALALLLLVIAATADFFIVSLRAGAEFRRQIAKKYFLYGGSGLVVITGIILCTFSVLSICHGGKGISKLVLSIIVLLVGGFGLFGSYLFVEEKIKRSIPEGRVKSNNTKVHYNNRYQQQSGEPEQSDRTFIYCYKCGRKIPIDSSYCTSCGTKICEPYRGNVLYCRFCGKEIRDDSEYCVFCGKKALSYSALDGEPLLDNAIQEKSDNTLFRESERKENPSSALKTITKVSCYISLAVFMLFSFKMIPSTGTTKVFLYCLAATIAIGLVVLFTKKVLTSSSKRAFIIALVSSLMVVLLTISLRIIYEAKVDRVKQSIPASGEVNLQLWHITNYYNSFGAGYIHDPYTRIYIDNELILDDTPFLVEMDKEYPLKIEVGSKESNGQLNTTITFVSDEFENGKYVVNERIGISDGLVTYATSQIIVSRYCTFWEVIFE